MTVELTTKKQITMVEKVFKLAFSLTEIKETLTEEFPVNSLGIEIVCRSSDIGLSKATRMLRMDDNFPS